MWKKDCWRSSASPNVSTCRPQRQLPRRNKRTAEYVPGGDVDNQAVRPWGQETHAHHTQSRRPIHVYSLGQVDILAKDVLQSWEMVEKDAAALAPRRGPSLLPWPPPDGPFPPYRWGTCSEGCAPIEAADRVVGHSVDHVVKFYDNYYSERPSKRPGNRWRWALERPLSAHWAPKMRPERAPWAHSTTLVWCPWRNIHKHFIIIGQKHSVLLALGCASFSILAGHPSQARVYSTAKWHQMMPGGASNDAFSHKARQRRFDPPFSGVWSTPRLYP